MSTRLQPYKEYSSTEGLGQANGYIGMKWTGLSPLFPGTDDSEQLIKKIENIFCRTCQNASNAVIGLYKIIRNLTNPTELSYAYPTSSLQRQQSPLEQLSTIQLSGILV